MFPLTAGTASTSGLLNNDVIYEVFHWLNRGLQVSLQSLFRVFFGFQLQLLTIQKGRIGNEGKFFLDQFKYMFCKNII